MVHSPILRFSPFLSRFFSGLFASFLAGGVLMLAGCHQAVTDPKDPKFIVAEKPGDWQITRADLDKEMDNFLRLKNVTAAQVGPARMLALQSVLLKNMVNTKLILARAEVLQFPDVDQVTDQQIQALKDRLPPGADLDSKLKEAGITMDILKKNIRDQVLMRDVLKAEALTNDEPTDQQINDFYLQHKDLFVTPPQIRASRIVVMVDPGATAEAKAAKKKIIDAARARVMKGEDFSKVAAQVTEDRSEAPKGGDDGWFRKGIHEEGFDDVAFKTKLNEVSPVFPTPMGYEFLKVTDEHPANQLTEAEVHSTIADALRRQTDTQKVKDYTEKLLANSGVVFHLAEVNADGGTGNPSQSQGTSGQNQPEPAGSQGQTNTVPANP